MEQEALLYIMQNIGKKNQRGGFMNYVCELCGYVYKAVEGDPENGIAAGTDFEDIPQDWCCPLCGAGKEDFEALDQDEE